MNIIEKTSKEAASKTTSIYNKTLSYHMTIATKVKARNIPYVKNNVLKPIRNFLSILLYFTLD